MTSVSVMITSDGSKSRVTFCSPDVEVVVLPTVPARPGFDAKYKISCRNKGNQVENGSVSLTFEDTVLDYLFST